MIDDTYQNINRALQVKLSSAVLGLLMHSESNYSILLVYLIFAIVLFRHFEFVMFQDVSAIMLITFFFQILNVFNTDLPLGIVIVNGSFVFLLLQGAIDILDMSFLRQIMKNAQYLLAGLVVQVMQSSISQDYVIVAVLIVIIMLFNFLGYENSDLCALYFIAAITVIQQCVLASLPVVFLLPSLVMTMYALDVAAVGLKSVETLSGFILYNSAGVLQSGLQSFLPYDIAFFSAAVATCCVYFLKMPKIFELGKTLCLLQAVDLTMYAISGMYQNDPALCLVLTLFAVRMMLS